MEITVLENQKTRLKLEVKDEGNSLCNAITKELWADKNVDISGYRISHSLVSEPTLIVDVKTGEAKKALLLAVDRLRKRNKQLKDQFKLF